MNTLEQGPKTGRWIPVGERLPEEHKYMRGEKWRREVLVTAELTWDRGHYFITTVEANDIAVINKKGADGIHILAWMPFPTPYDPQESER